MSMLLDYASKAQDAQFSVLSKGSDFFFKTAEQATAAMEKAPKTPDALAKAVKPLVTAVGTPSDLMNYAKSSTERLSAAVGSFQDRLAGVVQESPVEKFAERSVQA